MEGKGIVIQKILVEKRKGLINQTFSRYRNKFTDKFIL